VLLGCGRRTGPRWTWWPINGKVSAVADAGYIAIVVASLGAYWWRHLRPARPQLTVGDLFAPDAEVALHVATHEATTRRQAMSSLHVLYGLLQDEALVAAITGAGGNPDALEDRVLAALDAPATTPEDVGALIDFVAAQAHHAARHATCVDLWAALRGSAAAQLLDDSGLDRRAVLFVLFHGHAEPDLAVVEQRDVLVVLRNDHFTTQTFVCTVLRDVFELPDGMAETVMRATHTDGRAVVGRFTAAAARSKIAAARALARAQTFPLWIGVEPT
jgi:ATP-dependent Clp protease adaptor protein ClpS